MDILSPKYWFVQVPVYFSKLTTVRKYCVRNQSLMFLIKYIAWLVQSTTESSRKKEVSHLAKLLYFILSTSFSFSFLRPLPTASAQWVILSKRDTKNSCIKKLSNFCQVYFILSIPMIIFLEWSKCRHYHIIQNNPLCSDGVLECLQNSTAITC